MDETSKARLAAKLQFLYGDTRLLDELQSVIQQYPVAPRSAGLTERDALVITYGDHLQQDSEAPLATLGQFAEHYLRGLVSGIHILPFFPTPPTMVFPLLIISR